VHITRMISQHLISTSSSPMDVHTSTTIVEHGLKPYLTSCLKEAKIDYVESNKHFLVFHQHKGRSNVVANMLEMNSVPC